VKIASKFWFQVLSGIIVQVILSSGLCLAEPSDVQDEESLVDWAYASFLGTGFYKTSGRSIQVFNLPLTYTVRKAQNHPWGLKATFPIAFSLVDFRVDDLIKEGLPEDFRLDLKTVSVLPGLEFEIPVRNNWSIIPLGSFGFGKDFSGGDLVYIYSAGIKSRAALSWRQFEFTLGNKLLYAGNVNPGVNLSDDFAWLETGLDLTHSRLRFNVWGHPSNASFYVINHLYLPELEFLRVRDRPVEVKVQYELGFTLTTQPTEKIGLFDKYHIGLGYRFGDRLTAVRLLFGMPF
jgi:hypothetical protein